MSKAVKTLKGTIASLALTLNTLFWCVPVYSFYFLKILVPYGPWKNLCTRIITFCAEQFCRFNGWYISTLYSVHWDFHIPENLSKEKTYIVNCNHQSWVDIVVLQKAFTGKIPLLKFFIKRELRFVPLLGVAWMALDFPMMRRYSKEYLAKHPEKQGLDFLETVKACEKFKKMPTSVLNFMEGTRFKKSKHQRQNSPYHNLLKPKTGGTALALTSLGRTVDAFIDVTIYYPDKVPSFWDYLSGSMKKVTLKAELIQIPDEFYEGDYTNDPDFKEKFQSWVNESWRKKDDLITSLNDD